MVDMLQLECENDLLASEDFMNPVCFVINSNSLIQIPTTTDWTAFNVQLSRNDKNVVEHK